MSATPQIKPSPSHIPEFDRVMRELVGVDPNEIDNVHRGYIERMCRHRCSQALYRGSTENRAKLRQKSDTCL